MEKTMKVREVAEAYQILGSAKYQKLADEDKIKVWKLARQMEPIATKYSEDVQDAQEKMKPCEDFYDQLGKARQYDQAKQKGEEELPMSADEYEKFIGEWKNYNQLVEKAVKELAEKECDFKVEALTEEAFGKLMSSNDWNMYQVMTIGKVYGF